MTNNGTRLFPFAFSYIIHYEFASISWLVLPFENGLIYCLFRAVQFLVQLAIDESVNTLVWIDRHWLELDWTVTTLPANHQACVADKKTLERTLTNAGTSPFPLFLNNIFNRKCTRFVSALIPSTNGTPSTYLQKSTGSLFNFCNWLNR